MTVSELKERINQEYRFVQLDAEQQERLRTLVNIFGLAAETIASQTQTSRAQSIALSSLREAFLWSKAALEDEC